VIWQTNERRAVGVYSSKKLMSAMASAGVRGRKTLVNGWGLIWGNLCSMYYLVSPPLVFDECCSRWGSWS
jgi:hypothetical protein